VYIKIMETMKKAMEGVGTIPVTVAGAEFDTPQRAPETVPLDVDRRNPYHRKLARLLPGGWKQLQQISEDEHKAAKEAQAAQ
jgi:hypothetical protein